ncbi:MAG: hypothetical protein LRY75_20030 [Shewanella xiamenensis]|nr:hypothetical protein [Shewanella xiamenensis]
MVILTSFIGVLAILCSWKEIVQRIGFFHLNLLWILGGVLGVFMAVDLFLFFFFWEMMLVPMYFLIALWGHSVTDGKSRKISLAPNRGDTLRGKPQACSISKSFRVVIVTSKVEG